MFKVCLPPLGSLKQATSYPNQTLNMHTFISMISIICVFCRDKSLVYLNDQIPASIVTSVLDTWVLCLKGLTVSKGIEKRNIFEMNYTIASVKKQNLFHQKSSLRPKTFSALIHSYWFLGCGSHMA